MPLFDLVTPHGSLGGAFQHAGHVQHTLVCYKYNKTIENSNISQGITKILWEPERINVLYSIQLRFDASIAWTQTNIWVPYSGLKKCAFVHTSDTSKYEQVKQMIQTAAYRQICRATVDL